MIKQVFIGGHFSSGTRVVQFLLKQFYNIGTTKSEEDDGTLDYEVGFIEKDNTFTDKVLRGERPELGIVKEPFSLKNPDFMLAVPYLKELFPDSKFILVVRNGLDQILCNNRRMSERYLDQINLIETDFLKREMEYWNKIYKKAIDDGGVDLIVRLEDLVYNTKREVKKIVKLLGISYPDTSMIKVPNSMKRYKKSHIVHTENSAEYPQGRDFVYDPSMRQELCEVGREMMKYFNYL